MRQDDPRLEDVLAAWLASGLAQVYTATPATVVTFNAATQSATVQPILRARVQDPDTGETTPDTAPPPPIPNVPVLFPSGGGRQAAVTFPLSAGDPVLLVFSDRSLDEFKSTGRRDVTPQDPRRRSYSDAIAIPGGPRAFQGSGAGSTGALPVEALGASLCLYAGALRLIQLGSTGATQPVVKGTELTIILTALGTALAGAADPVVSAAGGALNASLGTGIHLSTKVLTD